DCTVNIFVYLIINVFFCFFFSSRRRHTRSKRDWSSDVCSSDLWLGTAGYDREDEDYWGKEWAKHYVDFATEEKRAWLHEKGVRFFPVVGWAERGGYLAEGHGTSVPRIHITW